MLRILTEEEELKSRYNAFHKIRVHSLIKFGSNRHVLVYCLYPDDWSISGIELTKENIEKIFFHNIEAEDLNLFKFEEMNCLNILGVSNGQ